MVLFGVQIFLVSFFGSLAIHCRLIAWCVTYVVTINKSSLWMCDGPAGYVFSRSWCRKKSRMKSIWWSESSIWNPFSWCLRLVESQSRLNIINRKYKLYPIDHIFGVSSFMSMRRNLVAFFSRGFLFVAWAHLKSFFYFSNWINDGINLIRYMNQSRSMTLDRISSCGI